MHIDDAAAFIVNVLRNPRTDDGYPSYEYDVWLPKVILAYIREVERSTEQIQSLYRGRRSLELSPFFYDAAWHLCRRGILRPGIQDVTGAGPVHGASAEGYNLTAVGRSWIEQGAQAVFLADPDRLSQMFDKLSPPFGPGFLRRATEAVRCHRFGAYLGCCAMCGAAAESILLAVATAKSGNEGTVLATYRSTSGRRRVVDSVIGQARSMIAEPFRSATGLLSFWRDDAAHGLASEISEIEAHEALARFLRFAQFATDNWDQLTRHDRADV
jgi:hypothetical protein